MPFWLAIVATTAGSAVLATILGTQLAAGQGSLPGRRHLRLRPGRAAVLLQPARSERWLLGRFRPALRPGQALLAVLPGATHLLLRGPGHLGGRSSGGKPVPGQRRRSIHHGGARQRECRRRLPGASGLGEDPCLCHRGGTGGYGWCAAQRRLRQRRVRRAGKLLRGGRFPEPRGHGGHRRDGLGDRSGHRRGLGHRDPRPGPQQRRCSGCSRRASGSWPSCSTSPGGSCRSPTTPATPSCRGRTGASARRSPRRRQWHRPRRLRSGARSTARPACRHLRSPIFG